MWFKGCLLFLLSCHKAVGFGDPLFGTNNILNDPSIDISVVSVTPFFGNGGHWDDDKKVLYFVDVVLGKVFKYDPATGDTFGVFVGFGLANFVPVQDKENLYLASVELSVYLVGWDGISTDISSKEELFNVEAQDRTNFRFNYGRADKYGVYYTGTSGKIAYNLIGIESVDPGKAALYQYRVSGGSCEVNEVVSDAGSVTGVAWSPDNTIMYYTDIAKRSIEAFDYDLATATMSNRRTLFDLRENGFKDTSEHIAVPISVMVDDQGNLWTPIFGFGKVLKISPDGVLLQEIILPSVALSALVWGGEDMSTLYVTTAPVLLKPLDLITNLRAGSVFAIEGTGSRGLQGGSFKANYCSP